MAGKGSTFANDLVALIFNATAIANIADNTATSPLANLFVSLHTADPGPAGNQTTSEATYTSYARVAVARTSGGWTVSAADAKNVAAITFPACTGGTNTITHCAIGTVTGAGTGKILYSGALTAPLAVSAGITPQFAINALSTTEA